MSKVTVEGVDMEDDGGLEEPGLKREAVHIQEVIPKELDVEQLQQTVIAVGREAALAYVREVILATEVEAAHIQEVIRDLEGEEGDKSEGLRGVEVEDDGPRKSESEVEDDKSEEPRGMEAEVDGPRVSEVEDDGPVGTGKYAMEDDSKLEGPGELGMEVGDKLILTGESELSEVEDHSKLEKRKRTEVEDDDKLKGPVESEAEEAVGEVQPSQVQLGKWESTQPCKLCGQAFSSEFQLLLHFHEEHLRPQRTVGETGGASDFEFISDDGSESELESEEDSNEEPATGILDFVTDYERALLQEPVINPSELEDDTESESDHEENYSELIDLENEDLNRSSDGSDDIEGNRNIADCGSLEEPAQLPSSFRPTKSIVAESASNETTSSRSCDKRQLALRLLPLPRSPRKVGLVPGPKRKKPEKESDNDQENRIPSSSPEKKRAKHGGITPSTSASSPPVGDYQFECIFCEKTYAMSFLLCGHIRSHIMELPYFCKSCDQSFAQENYLTKHIKRCHSGSTPYKCKLCPKSFSTRRKLISHGAVHKSKRKFTCTVCNTEFLQRELLKEHEAVHANEKPFECKYCKRHFKFKRSLDEHLTLHTGALFQCDHCKKGFIRRDHLKIHVWIKIHEKKEKQIQRFECLNCKGIFNRISDLNRHMRVHGSDKPFKCEHCKKGFIRKDHLVVHLRSHSTEKEFQCEVCNMMFSGKSSIQRHMKMHTGDLRYECDDCKEKFHRTDYLERHMRLCHNSKNPFGCQLCEEQFSSKEGLKIHKRLSHKRRRNIKSSS